MENFSWPHKDLLDVDCLTVPEVYYLLDMAEQFQEINSRAIKKVPTLRGKGIILFFAENSTRTKTTFDIAAKRLSADTFSLAKSESSLNKGESLKDTALTLQAMSPDIIVIRHNLSGSAAFLAERVNCSIVNAGDGWHAHPTQALLDAYTLRKYWREKNTNMQGKSLLIVGDIAHSRVARSNIRLMTALGLKVRIFAPKTLLPKGVEHWPVQIFDRLDKAIEGADAVMCLRLQLERQAAGLLPNLSEYASKFCVSKRLMSLATPNAPILHPGPLNRGLEVADDLADATESLVLDQVSAGVAVRMAVLFLLGTRKAGSISS
jgi:aspartate carbamoyltransferase catalytic subunit